MMKKSRGLILYLKVFCILFIVGIILPNIIGFLINKLTIYNDKVPLGNSIYVMYSKDYERSFFEILRDLSIRIINF